MNAAYLFIDGEWTKGNSEFPVLNKFNGEQFTTAHSAGPEHVKWAIDSAYNAFRRQDFDIPTRYEVLMRAKDILVRRKDEIIGVMVAETGFSRFDSTGDFNRCVQTLLTSAEEAKRLSGEVIPIDAAPGHHGEIAFTIRVPLGVVVCITPFNSPLNTVAHKIGPALAAGNSVVLKPASYTPLSAKLLTEVLVEAGLPNGWLNLVYGSGGQLGRLFSEDQRVRYFAFTGGGPAGESIQRLAGLRRTQLELGSISATIVCADADLDVAAAKSAGTAFRKAGQVCTSLQRLFVHNDVIDSFADKLVAKAKTFVIGDPAEPSTTLGPMISSGDAQRAETWIKEAVEGGARVLTGGNRDRSILEPTVLTNVNTGMRVMSEEIFAPVVSLVPFTDLDEAIDAVNDTPYGLSSGIFTTNIHAALSAAKRIEVGLFNINNTSSNRADLMPYGGCKNSGFGKEGPRAAIRDMTDERLITITE